MSRVMPMIVTCLGLVGYAVFQSQTAQAEDYSHAVPAVAAIEVDTLTR